MHAEKMLAKRVAAPFDHLGDRETRRSGRDNRIRAAVAIDQLEEVALERKVLGQRFEYEARLANRALEVGVVAAELDMVGDGLGARGILRGPHSGLGLVALAREHRYLKTRAGEDTGRARAHGAISAQNHNLDIVAQSDSPFPGILLAARRTPRQCPRPSASSRRRCYPKDNSHATEIVAQQTFSLQESPVSTRR